MIDRTLNLISYC